MSSIGGKDQFISSNFFIISWFSFILDVGKADGCIEIENTCFRIGKDTKPTGGILAGVIQTGTDEFIL